MRFPFTVIFFIALCALALAVGIFGQTAPRSAQIVAGQVDPSVPANERVRILAFDEKGDAYLAFLDGFTVRTTSVGGRAVISAIPAPPIQLAVRRHIVPASAPGSGDYTLPATVNINSVMVFRNGNLQTETVHYEVNPTTRRVTFLPASKPELDDLVHYYWLEVQVQ